MVWDGDAVGDGLAVAMSTDAEQATVSNGDDFLW